MNQLDTSQEFISRLSHEIRNPITLICSSLQLLEIDCPSVAQSDLWPQIQLDLQSVLRLLKDISTLNNRQKLTISNIHAETFLSEVASSFRSLAASRGITFFVDLSSLTSPSVPDETSSFTPDKITDKFSADTLTTDTLTADKTSSVIIACDEIKLREALMNLLINAADAVVPASSSPQILLQAKLSETHLQIHIKDNGPGIPDSYLPTLFDPFVTHKAGGTGLGLNIVKNIAEWHHGTVTVQTCCSSGHSGTDFCITVPLNHSYMS